MATFPALVPASVEIIPGTIPGSVIQGYDGSTVTSSADAVANGDRLTLVFRGPTEAQVNGVRDHLRDQSGRPFSFDAATLAPALTRSGYAWVYAAEPEQEDVRSVAGSEMYFLTCTFKAVRVRVALVPCATSQLRLRTSAAQALPAGPPTAISTLLLTTTAAGVPTTPPSATSLLILRTTPAAVISTPLNDSLYGSVILHLPLNSASGFADVSGRAVSITPQGGVSIETAGLWGNGHALFNGTSGYLSAELADILGTGDYTIRFWFNPINATNDGLYQFTVTSGSYGPLYAFLGNIVGGSYPLAINNDPNAGNITVGTVAANAWYFYQQTRTSGGVRTSISTVDGTTVYDPLLANSPRSWTNNFTQTFIDIGLYFNNSYTFYGRMLDFQVTKAARPHTIPTGPLPIF